MGKQLQKLSFCAILVVFCAKNALNAQINIQVRVNSGSSGTSCTDGFFGGAPDPQWRVNIANQGWTTYPRSGICFTNTPNTQYNEDFDCPPAPTTIDVCFRPFEDDGAACIVSESCLAQICGTFSVPAVGSSATYSLTIPNNGSNPSWGTVNFTISASGSYAPGGANDLICNAINLGNLPFGGNLGNPNASNYGNFCAGSAGESDPSNWDNEQGVWFQFTTSSTPSTVIEIEGYNDPASRGDQIDVELALYRSSNGACSGTLTEVASEHTFPLYGEEMQVECLAPNTTYYVMVDGFDNGFLGGQEGFFGLQVRDGGIQQSADLICNSRNLGSVPAGGSVTTGNLNQSNICAGNAGDPTPSGWGTDQTVWFTFFAPPSGSVTVETDSDLPWPLGDDAIDLQVALYESNNNSCNGTLIELISDYDPVIFDEDFDYRCLTPGRQYWIMIDGSALNVEGIFDLTITDLQEYPAPNDEICDALHIGTPAVGAPVRLNNQRNFCADNIFEPFVRNWGNTQGVWYTFVAPTSGRVVIDGFSSSGDNIDLQLAVFDSDNMGCTGNLTELASEYDGFGLVQDEEMEVRCLVPGRTYYILVDGEPNVILSDLNEGIFDIRVSEVNATPPMGNDLPCGAIHLGTVTTGGTLTTRSGGNQYTQNNFCATANGEPGASAFDEDQTVWYTFVAPPSGHVSIEADQNGTLLDFESIDLQLAVYESSNNTCNGTFREIESEYDGFGLLYDEEMDVNCLEPGRTYFLMVDGESNFLQQDLVEGYFDLFIRDEPLTPSATNDEICNAISLGNPWTNGPVTLANQTNICARAVGEPDPTAFDLDQTVWYSFTTPPSGTSYACNITASTNFLSNDRVDLQIAVYQSSNGTCTGVMTEIESDYDPVDFPPLDESIDVQCLWPNTTYYVQVDGSPLFVEGIFSISISTQTASPIATNDTICRAVALGAVPIGGSINNGIVYNNFCAETEAGEPSPGFVGGIDQTVWFTFTAPNHTGPNASANVSITALSDPTNLGDDIDIQMALYRATSCNGPFGLLEWEDDVLFNNTIDITCLVPGQTYYLQVDGSDLNVEGYFTLEIEDDGAGTFPINDNICNAVALGTVPNGGTLNNGTIYHNRCATTQSGEYVPNAFGIDQTVWFSFVAPASGNATVEVNSDPTFTGDAIDLELAVYESSNNLCSGQLLEIDSDYDAGLGGEELVLTCLTPGQLYFVQVDGNSADIDGNFNITVEDDGGSTNRPYNNDICDAFDFGTPSGTASVRGNETNDCANVEFGEPGATSYARNTVWYRFTAPTSGAIEISLDGLTPGIPPFIDIDPEVRLFSSSNNGCSGALSQLENSYRPGNGSFLAEEIESECLVPGNIYYIQVDGTDAGDQGRFRISVRDPFPLYGTNLPGDPEPNNNECPNAIPLTVQSSSCFAGTGNFSTLNYGQPTISPNTGFASCGQNCGDTWYSFTMPGSGLALIEGDDDAIMPGFNFSDLSVAAYTGSCGSLNAINCQVGGLTSDVNYQVSAPPGTTVYVQVFNQGADDNNENFQLCISQSCGADDCLPALINPMIPNTPYCFALADADGENLSSGTPGYTECSAGAVQDEPDHSVYYSFRSDCNGSAMTVNIINTSVDGFCLGGIPSNQFSYSLFQDATPCDNNPDAMVDCQVFTTCNIQPVNWSRTYTNLQPNTDYIILLEGGIGNLLSADVDGFISINTSVSPQPVITNNSRICPGTNTGTATATPVANTGTPPFTYLWSNGQTTQTATGLTAGTYRVTLTDANGCTVSEQTTIFAHPPFNTTVTPSGPTTFCPGGQVALTISGGSTFLWSTGATTATITAMNAGTYYVTATSSNNCPQLDSIVINHLPIPLLDITGDTILCDNETSILTASGGVSYLWSTGVNTASISVSTAGVYQVTATGANTCTVTDFITVVQSPPISLSETITNVSCFGGNNGAISTITSGGVPPFDYLWTTGATTDNISSLVAGNYRLTVTDVNTCSAIGNYTVTEPAVLALSFTLNNNVSCNGGSNGSATANVLGGTTPYSYLWSNGTTTQTNGTALAGAHSLTVTDTNGCTASGIITISEPTPLSLSGVVSNVLCNGGNSGTISSAASGGTPGYGYVWPNATTNAIATGLTTGVYVATVTDANNCSATASFTVTEPQALTASITGVTDVLCFGGNSGTATLSVTGGTPGYTYRWSNGETVQNAIALTNGSHAVSVTDTNGCMSVATVTINQAAARNPQVAVDNHVSCFGGNDGQATASQSGGTLPYQFLWANGQTNATVTALANGSHSLTITDGNGCRDVLSVSITQPTAITITEFISNVLCFGQNNGNISLVITGGTGGYGYLWGDGSTISAITGLIAGNYSVTVNDANGCTATENYNVTEPALLQVNITELTSIRCFGENNGVIRANPTGGTSPYNYQWNNSQNAQNANGLVAGNYQVTVTDDHGCTATTSFNLVEPAQLSNTFNNSNVVCFGQSNGSSNAQPTGGTPPYSYRWDTGGTSQSIGGLLAGTYTLVLTDSKGCSLTQSTTITQPAALDLSVSVTPTLCPTSTDGTASVTASGGTPGYAFIWDNGQTGVAASGFTGGTHFVSVTDGNGCTLVEPFNIPSPNPILLSFVTNDVRCIGGSDASVQVNATRGSGGYTYVWNTGQTTSQITNLLPGNYFVTVTDRNGCSTTGNASVGEPSTAVSVTIVRRANNGCFGESNGLLVAGVSGGTPDYTFFWSVGGAGNSATGLPAGVYQVTATDARGCTATTSATVTEPSQLAMQVVGANAGCPGDDNGSITAVASGGTRPYFVQLNGGGIQNVPANDTITLTGLTAGSYSVSLVDQNGCSVSRSSIIRELPPVLINLLSDTTISMGDTADLRVVHVSPASQPQYAWSPLGTLNCSTCRQVRAFPLETTVYYVTVTDSYGCTAIDNATVRVDEARNVFIPTAFTPNSDGHNDVFHVYAGPGVAQVKRMIIADRWGEIVFDASDIPANSPIHGWDGRLKGDEMMPGTFVYFIQVEFVNGHIQDYEGDVTLLR